MMQSPSNKKPKRSGNFLFHLNLVYNVSGAFTILLLSLDAKTHDHSSLLPNILISLSEDFKKNPIMDSIFPI